MKSEKELNELKENLETLSAKLKELTPEEQKKVTGGIQLCDTVRSAITTATADPKVITCE